MWLLLQLLLLLLMGLRWDGDIPSKKRAILRRGNGEIFRGGGCSGDRVEIVIIQVQGVIIVDIVVLIVIVVFTVGGIDDGGQSAICAKDVVVKT